MITLLLHQNDRYDIFYGCRWLPPDSDAFDKVMLEFQYYELKSNIKDFVIDATITATGKLIGEEFAKTTLSTLINFIEDDDEEL